MVKKQLVLLFHINNPIHVNVTSFPCIFNSEIVCQIQTEQAIVFLIIQNGVTPVNFYRKMWLNKPGKGLLPNFFSETVYSMLVIANLRESLQAKCRRNQSRRTNQVAHLQSNQKYHCYDPSVAKKY